ncbi:MAG: DUF2318 domain-containing protein [Desulfobacterales bacterium]
MSNGKKKETVVEDEKRSAGETSGAAASPEDRRAAKKAIVLGTEKRNRKPLVAFLCCVVIIVAGAFYFMTRTDDQVGAIQAENTGDSAAKNVAGNGASEVTFPASLFDDGSARYFQYADSGTTIRYFVLKSSDGVIRAAFDACDVCWREGKGYQQEGDVMVCRNCGQRFASVRVNEVKGGCNPAPIDRKIRGDQVVLQVKNIIAGRGYFNLPGRT